MASRVLDQYRKQNPQIADKADHEIARDLYSDHYADMDFTEFADRVELEPLDRVRAVDPEKADKPDDQLATEVYQQSYSDMDFRDFLGRVGMSPDSYPGLPSESTAGLPPSSTGPGPATGDSVRSQPVGSEQPTDLMGAGSGIIDGVIDSAVDALPSGDYEGADRREARGDTQAETLTTPQSGSGRRGRRADTDAPTLDEPTESRRERRVVRNRPDPNQVGRNFSPGRQDALDAPEPLLDEASSPFTGSSFEQTQGIRDAALSTYLMEDGLSRAGDDLGRGFNRAQTAVKAFDLVDAVSTLESAQERTRERAQQAEFNRMRLTGDSTDQGPDSPEAVARRIESAARRDQDIMARYGDRVESIVSDIEQLQQEREELGENVALQQALESGDADQFLSALDANPGAVMSGLLLESTAAMAPVIGAGVVGGVAGGPAGVAAGTGAASAAVESLFTLQEKLQEYGADLSDPESVNEVWQERGGEIVQDAAIRSAAIGLFDAAAGGIGSKAMLPAIREGASRSARAARAAADVSGRVTTQGALGGGGEAAAQLGTEGRISRPADVLAEAVAEFGFAPIEVASTSAAAARRRIQGPQDREAIRRRMLDQGFVEADDGTLQTENVTVELGDNAATATVTTPSPQVRTARRDEDEPQDQPTVAPRGEAGPVPVSERSGTESPANELDSLVDTFASPGTLQRQIDITRDQERQLTEQLRQSGLSDEEIEADGAIQNLRRTAEQLESTQRQIDSRAAEQQANTAIDEGRQPTNDALGQQVEQTRGEAAARSPLSEEIQALRQRFSRPAPLTDQAPDLGAQERSALQRETDILRGRPSADRPVNNPETGEFTSERVATENIQIDPETYQFRDDVNRDGVDDRLSGITRFDDLRAGTVILHERNDGQIFVADGHHRVDLARQLGRDSINAVVLRESDGVSASDARQYAAERNVVEGNATPLDAAKVFRERGGDPATVIEDRDLPRRSQVVRDGAAIAQLSDDAFGAVLNEQITEKDAAAIGRNFTDPDQQLAAVQQYQRVRPANDRQREILADEIRAAGFSQGEQGGLFGEDPAESLITERVRVKDALTRRLSRNRSLFRTLNENAGTAERAGNQIARDRNDAIQQDAAMAADLVRQADTTPSLNQAINEAAQRVKDGESMNRVTAELETRVINEAQQLRAQPQGAPTDNRAGSTDQAGQDAGASQSVRSGDAGRDPAGGESGLPGAESELLTQPTPEDLQARDQAEADRQAAQREAERRADADDQRDNFTLTGSDTEADQAAARGQDALFEGSPAAYTGAGANRIITGQTNTVARESGNEQQIQGDLFTLAGADSVSPRSPDSAFNLDGATEVLSTPTGRFGTVTSTRRTVTYSLPDKPINTAADAATATAQVRKNAQENLLALVTDADGNVLDIIRHSVGDVDSAAANTSLIAGSVLRVPDAANVWVSHNHPGGVSTLSNADKRVFAGLSDLMSGSGVTPQGVLAIGNGRYSAELADGQNVDESTIPPARRTREVAASERTLMRRENLGEAISSPDSARASVRNLGGSEPGIALLNNRNKPVAWIPLSIQEMSRMRSGGVLSRVLQSIERSNANTAILSVGESSLSRSDAQKAVGNMSSFFTAANVRMLDAVSTFSVETLAGNPVVANDVDSQTPDTFFSLGSPAEGPETPATPLDGATEVVVDGTTRPALNSEGRPIHSTIEGARNFWRWFGDSKVTDEQGRPRVVYHGTAQDFDAFSEDARGSSTGAENASFGYFFSSEPVVAGSFASLAQRRTGEGQGANIIPAYIRITDAVEVEGPDVSIDDTISDGVEQGRDGVIFYGVNDTARTSPVAIDGRELDGVDSEGQFVAESLPIWEEGGNITRQEIQDELDAAVDSKENELSDIRNELANETSDSEIRLLRNEITQVEQERQIFSDLAAAWRDDPSRVTLVNDTSDVFVAFEAGQVKSAAGNAGSFDGSQDSLRLATGAGQGVNTAEAAQRAANLMGDWKIAPTVKVAATESELPPAVRRKIDARRAQGRVRGVFHKGEVFVVAENLNSLQEMEETILHEVLGHFGIRNVLGANMNKVLDDAYLTIGRSGLQDIANRYKLDLDKRAGRREAVEEYLANMAQTNPDAQIIDRMIRMIREWARSMGFSLNMSNAEVRELINRARRFTRDGEIVSGLTIKESISGGVAMSANSGQVGLDSGSTRLSINKAVAKANEQEEQVYYSTEDKFFGDFWPAILRSVGVNRKPSIRNLRPAARQGIDDMRDWLRDNPKFMDYYAADMAATREVLETTFGKLSDEQFQFFQVLLGLNSPNTGLRSNINDAFNVMDLYLKEGNLDSITLGTSAKGYTVVKDSPFQISGTTAPTKARSMKIVDRLIQERGGIQQAIDYLQEEVPAKELQAFNREMGYKGQVGQMGSIRSLVKEATGQSEKIPRMFVFGRKVGAYTLNTIGDSRYTTIDIWESRFIRSYFTGMFKSGTGLPVNAEEHEFFSQFNKVFRQEIEKDFGQEFEASALQAMRWFFILNSVREAGYTNARTESTISEYARDIAEKRFGVTDYGSGQAGNAEDAGAAEPRFSLEGAGQPSYRPLPADETASADDLTQSFPESIYDDGAAEIYGGGTDREQAVLDTLRSVRGQPDATVTIYRANPEGVEGIEPGDFVTLSREYAEDAAEGMSGRVTEMQVPASTVTVSADDLLEQGYYPDGNAEADDSRFMFAGANAEGSDTLSLRKALLMRDGKMPNYVVIRETGWFQGPDGKMRYEIDDSQAELDMESIRGSIRTGEQITLQDAIVHPSLFAAYPGLARLQVFVDDTGKYGGLYNLRGDFIQMNQRLLQAPDQFRSTLLHEIQHAVQNREGFSPGGLASDAMRARVGRAAGDLRDVAADRVLAFEYHNPGIDDREALASFQASMALRYQSAQRLKEYGQKEKPSGVMRLIRKEMQWLYEPDLDQSGSEARRLQADFYNIPKRGAGRNRELGEFAFEAGRVIEGSIPDELLAQFRNDSRKMESMVKALSREAQRAREPVSQRDALKREAEKARKARENIARLDPYGVYRRLAGEVESRNVQTRRDMSADERSQRPPARTVDVDEDEIIVITGGLQMQLPESMASDDGTRFSQRPDEDPTRSTEANAAANQSGMPVRNGNKAAFETTVTIGKDESGREVPVTTSDPSIERQNKVKYWAKRLFTKEGQLTDTAYRRHTQLLGMNNADSIAIQGLSADFIQSIDRGYGKSYKRLTANEKELLNEYLAGSAVEGIPQAVRDELDVMRGMLDSMSNRMQMMILDEVRYALQDMDQAKAAQAAGMIRRARDGDESAITELQGVGERGGLIAKKMRTFLTVEENKGSYLNRSYQVFDDPKWPDRVPDDVVRRARTFLREQVRGDPVFQRFNEKQVEDRVEGLINAILRTDQSGITGFMGSNQLGEKDLSIIKRRKEIAEPIRDLMGEYKDPQLNFTKSMSGMSKMVASHHFLRNVREEGLGVFLSTTKEDRLSEQIADYSEERMLPLAGLYATPEFAAAMREFDSSGESGALMQNIVAVNSAIKYGKTVLSPTTMFRNFYSATMFTVMNGHFNYGKTTGAARAVFADITGNNKAQRDYLQKMARLGVIHDTARAGEIRAALEDVVNTDTTQGSAPVRAGKRVLETATNLYQAGDDFWKIVGFENEKAGLMKKGMAEAEAETLAATRIRDGYPTYSMVPEGIRWIRRFPLVGTFVSFPWEIMRTTGNQIRMTREDFKAGRSGMASRRLTGMAIASSAAYGVSVATMAMFGVDDEDDEAIRELAAPWQMNSMFAYLGNNEEGKMQYLDLSHLDPYTHMKRPLTAMMNGNYDSIQERVGYGMAEFLMPFLGPDIAAQAIGEAVLNSRLGSDRQIYDPNASPIQIGQDVFEHLRTAAQPGIASNIERTLKAFNQQMTGYGKQYNLQDEGLAWVGFRLTTSDPKVSLQFKAYDFQDQYSSAGSPTYELLRDPNEINPENLDGAVDRTYRRWRDAFSEMHSVVRAGRVTGMSDQDLAEALDKGGVPKKYIGPLIEEQVPPWSPSDQSISSAIQSVLQYNDTPAMRENLRERFKAMRREVTRQNRQLMKDQREQ